MLLNGIYKNISFRKKLPDLVKMVMLYRYLSLVITSLFFLIGNFNHSTPKRLFIILCISLSSVVLSHLYHKVQNSTPQTMILVFIETIGNSLFLIPSGGLRSPYVWYSLNTILISSIKLNPIYCWVNLFIYLVNSTWVSYLLLNNKTTTFINVILEQSNLILSFILITAVIQLLTSYGNNIENKSAKLSQVNTELVSANYKIKESMNHIMDLYQTVNLFTSQQNKGNLVEVIIDYTKKIFKTDYGIFIQHGNKDNGLILQSNLGIRQLEEKILAKIESLEEELLGSEDPINIRIDEIGYMFYPIKCNYKNFGILGVKIPKEWDDLNDREVSDQLRFVAQLSAIVLEKFELEQVNEGLLISEEQNRIANEIHDSILQKLFTISCGVYGVMKKLKNNCSMEVDSDLNAIRISINKAMMDLRSTIYGLSWRKDGSNNFINNIKNYIDEVIQFNNIEI